MTRVLPEPAPARTSKARSMCDGLALRGRQIGKQIHGE